MAREHRVLIRVVVLDAEFSGDRFGALGIGVGNGDDASLGQFAIMHDVTASVGSTTDDADG